MTSLCVSDENVALEAKLVNAIGDTIERVLDEQQRRDPVVIAITISALATWIAGIAANLAGVRDPDEFVDDLAVDLKERMTRLAKQADFRGH